MAMITSLQENDVLGHISMERIQPSCIEVVNKFDDIICGKDEFNHEKNSDLFFQTLVKNRLFATLKKIFVVS